MAMKLKREFFLDSPRTVAKNLLGQELVRKINGKNIVCRIVETEAYGGVEDKGSHAFGNKRTKRTEPMFAIGGSIYVYLIYGMYHLLNIVTGPIGNPNAVLIRGVEPIEGLELIKSNRKIKSKKKVELTNGPGKLSQGLGIDLSFNHKDIIDCETLYIRHGSKKVSAKEIIETPRINIDYAEEYKDKLWRYHIKDNAFVSK